MSERTFGVRIVVEQENDGAYYLKRGPESHTKTLTVDEALRSYSKEAVVRVLRFALAAAEGRDLVR